MNIKPTGMKKKSLLSLPLLVLLGATACTPMQATRGNWVEPDAVKELRPGVQTRADVAALLGAPDSTSTFDPNIWFYIGQRTEQWAFFRPKIKEQQVLALSFDANNRLDAFVVRGLDAYQEIQTVKEATPTAGHRLTFLEQMVGNVGRFNNKAPQATGRTPLP